MRKIFFDTKTTGFNLLPYGKGQGFDRIIEIGAIEVVGCKPTGAMFHKI